MSYASLLNKRAAHSETMRGDNTMPAQVLTQPLTFAKAKALLRVIYSNATVYWTEDSKGVWGDLCSAMMTQTPDAEREERNEYRVKISSNYYNSNDDLLTACLGKYYEDEFGLIGYYFITDDEFGLIGYYFITDDDKIDAILCGRGW